MGTISRRVHRPSPATVISLVALFVAISGTAIALPGKNTVNSGDIKNGQVKTVDVANDDTSAALRTEDLATGAVTSPDVLDDSLLDDDIGTDQVTASEIAAGAVNSGEILNNAVSSDDISDFGIGGIDIAAGTVDDSKLGTITTVNGNTIDFGDQSAENAQWVSDTSTATCPGGSTVISGGAELIGEAANEELAVSESLRNGANGWTVKMISDTDNTDARAVAYCLN